MRTFVKMIVAVIVATGMMLIMAQHGAGFKACIIVYMCVGILVSALLGVFDSADKSARKYRTKYGSIRHRMGYRRAA